MPTTREVDELTVRWKLRQEVKRMGSQFKFALEHNINPSTVNMVLSGKKSPTPGILKALKCSAITRYLCEELE